MRGSEWGGPRWTTTGPIRSILLMANTTETPIEGEPQSSRSESGAPDPIAPDLEPETPGPETPGSQNPGSSGPSWSRSAHSTTELRRPREGRMVAGVAAGIADRVGVDRWVIRLAFLVLSFGGGSGILLYIAAWLLMPEEGQAESVGQKWANQANSTRPWIGVVFVLIAAAILFSNFPFFDGGLLFPTALLVIGILLYRGDLPGINWKPDPDKTAKPTSTETINAMSSNYDSPTITQPIAPVVVKPRTPPSPLGQITVGVTIIALGLLAAIDRVATSIDADPRHYFALAVVTLGLGVLVGTYFGRARWLIPFALLLVPVMVGTSIADAFDGTWETPQVVRPTDFAGLAATYERGAGELVIDLTDLPWSGQTITFIAEVGVGELELRVPEGVAVEARGDVGIGEFATVAGSQGGFGIDRTYNIGGSGLGTVVATLEVGMGRIVVESDDNRLFDGESAIELAGIGDLVVKVNSTEGLEDSYTTIQGDITLDLEGLFLTEDRAIEVASDIGDITIILPVDTSYRVSARTDLGVVDLFGEDQVDRGGSVRADSITSETPIIELDIQSIEGDITLIQGERE
ncbi:MAG TPA: PspC domain-containing protein [Acidimicrobiia bacterium]|nr:PspC domain-containing protein [Acidimicrobiia bacterium]